MWKLFLLAVISVAVAEEGDKIYSRHVQTMPGSMDLTTGELKLFSGHAMNLVRTKCPAVDTYKIFQVQKYIGKLIAKQEIVPGTNKDFHNLLESMTTCAKQPKPQKTTYFTLPQLRSFRPVFFHSDDEKLPLKPKAGDVQVETVPEGSQEDGQPQRKVVTTTIFVRPEDVQEGIRSSGGFFNWVRGMFSRVHNFMSSMFTFGGNARSKREAETALSVIHPEYQVYVPEQKDSVGKKAFGQLVDELCRLYCDACNVKRIVNFKQAAKQLLEYLFEEDSGLELAANRFLDEEFIKSIHDCVA